MTPAPERKTVSRCALALQGLIALAVMAFALTPARGGAALYLPIGGNPAGAVDWARHEHAGYLAAGPYTGAAFVRVPSPAATLSALREGALLLAVPESLCGTSPRNNPASSS
ncbi:hypothetical protein WBP06_05465 [Novosphingobium sp. BL-8H]|uniref:hypothetical protein n=1 Tax=Novosphingobium sp. BL-8H TaxID=3127640 RepID=UPI003756EA68